MAHTNRVRPDTSTPAAPGDTANLAQRIKAALVSLGPFSAALVAYKAFRSRSMNDTHPRRASTRQAWEQPTSRRPGGS
ncbi:hypothetical protein [Streptomyces sp. NPDC058424]|uniref:hypothetical protein n=1 Tax=Streptomyces sp. NPDC058424 TaxID=3346491 RepID=UPI00364A61B5